MTSPLPDSGERIHFPTGMMRDVQTGKPRFDLLWPEQMPYEEQMLTRWATHMAAGAEKYEARNWEQAETPEELERYQASALRHMYQWLSGEDEEDHASAVYFNIMGAEYVKWRMGRKVWQRLTNEAEAAALDSWDQEADDDSSWW